MPNVVTPSSVDRTITSGDVFGRIAYVKLKYCDKISLVPKGALEELGFSGTVSILLTAVSNETECPVSVRVVMSDELSKLDTGSVIIVVEGEDNV